MTRWRSPLLLVLALCPAILQAQAASPTPTPDPSPSPRPTPGGDNVKAQEIIVVTASKQEEELGNAPVTMSVITNETLLTSHAQNYGDLLRSVPGVNAIQMSARDVNITSRQATGTLANTQLGLLDGRSIYLDLFGMIIWDFVPINPVDVKQIEVVRGPASAVWGANAFTGAVNIITKTPREAVGTTASFSGGLFSRDAGSTAGEGMGNSYGANLSLSRAPSDKIAFRVTGGFFHSDEFARPTGLVPCGVNPAFPDPKAPQSPCATPSPLQAAQTGGGTYPAYENEGTNQPKIELRLDQDLSGGARLSYSVGYGATSGMIHTGVGPFEMQDGSYLGYGRVAFTKGNLRVTTFANLLDVDAPNRIFRDPNNCTNPRDPRTCADLPGQFKTKTFDLEVGNSHLLGAHHILSYGGNARHNDFDISIADDGDDSPTKSSRDEFGGYLQDEIYYGKIRLTLGARIDKFSSIDDPMFSPRLAAVFKPMADHTLRASFNRAFRSPSVVNNHLSVQSVQGVPLARLVQSLPAPLQPLGQTYLTQPFPLRVQVVGNPNLVEDKMTAYEVGYTGTFGGKTTLTLAAYMNEVDDNINFVNVPASRDPYTSDNPPPDWFIPAAIEGQFRILDQLARAGTFLPRTVATYENLGPIRNKGIEVSLEHDFSNSLNAYVNYSWQDDPEPLDDPNPYPPEEISAPPTNRFNVGVSFKQKKLFGSASVNYSDEGFWSDVLTREYHGTTPSYTMFNASLGVRWNERVTFTLKGTNLTDEDIQQHIFGDILKRNIVGELRLSF